MIIPCFVVSGMVIVVVFSVERKAFIKIRK